MPLAPGLLVTDSYGTGHNTPGFDPIITSPVPSAGTPTFLWAIEQHRRASARKVQFSPSRVGCRPPFDRPFPYPSRTRSVLYSCVLGLFRTVGGRPSTHSCSAQTSAGTSHLLGLCLHPGGCPLPLLHAGYHPHQVTGPGAPSHCRLVDHGLLDSLPLSSAAPRPTPFPIVRGRAPLVRVRSF